MGKREQKILVQDTLCERLVLGALLTERGVFNQVSNILDDDCFIDNKNKEIWNAIYNLANKGEAVDVVTVLAYLAQKDSSVNEVDVIDIASNGVYYNVETHAMRLKELSLRRRLWALGQKLIGAGVAETEEVASIQQMATDTLNSLFDNAEGAFTLTDALLKLSDIITNNLSKGSNITGTPSGFRRIDAKGGLHGSDLIIIAGESSQGKSSLMLSIIKNAAEKGAKVAIYSLEMTKEQLAARMIAMKTGISASDIMYSGELSQYQLSLIDEAKGSLPGENIFFDERSTSSIETILLSIRNMKLRYNIDGAAVDYLQILNVNQRNNSFTREQAMGDASRRLKNLAKELDIWIIALSQLSRNQSDPVPTLSRLRDSGQIAEAADVVMLIYRPEYYHRTFPHPFENLSEDEVRGKAMIDIAKGRNIGVFQFLANFSPSTTFFYDIDDDVIPTGPIEEDAPF